MTVFGMIVLGVVVLCAGVLTSRTVAEMQLMRDAETHAARWTTILTSQPDQLRRVFGDHRVDNNTRHILETATRFTQVISYELYDERNQLFYSASSSDWNPKETTRDVLNDPITRNNIAQYRPSTRLHEVRMGDGRMNYAAVVLPMAEVGKYMGSVVAYVDQTDKAASIKSSLNVIALSTAGLLLLALGLPTIIIVGRKRAHDRAEDKVRFLSDHEALTGLPNRSAFNTKLEEVLAAASGTEQRTAVLIFDIHRFKEINDSLGHARADEFLKTVAAVIDDRLPENAYVARLGGDEFAVMLSDTGGADDVIKFAKAVCAAVAQASSQIWVGLNCSLNCGGAISPDHASDRHDLLRYADLALQAAKTEGAGKPRLFERGMDVAFMRKREREQDLRRAIDAGEFHVAYQPLVDASTGEISGHEALIRWNHPVHGKISPAYFISLAEETGLIVPLGAWALRTVCSEASAFPRPLKVAVNLSPLQFAEGKVAEQVAEVLKETGFDPNLLEVEITENVLLDNTESVLEELTALRELGVSIAMDDFGSGYSSLSYLSRFRFDKIKIDRQFVLSMGSDPAMGAIVKCIIAMGKSLGMTVVAEGVETKEQLEFLKAEGCDQVQGYLFGYPVRIGEATAKVNENLAQTGPKQLARRRA